MPNISKTSRSIQSAPGQSAHRRGQRRVRVVDARLDDQALEGIEISQHIVHLEPRASPAGIAKIIGRTQFREQIEPALVLEGREQFLSRSFGTNSRRLSRNRDVLKTPSPISRCEARECGGVRIAGNG